jgi:small subunit ribosomal protein S5
MFRPKTFDQVKDFEEKVVQVNRVSKKTKGGNRIGFSVLVVVGDKKGKVGVGLGKAPDVLSCIHKATRRAKKNLIKVPMKKSTIPHHVRIKFGAAEVLLKPAPPGSGIIAGGAVRAVMEAAGIKDISTKVLGTNNPASNVYAVIEALKKLKLMEQSHENRLSSQNHH